MSRYRAPRHCSREKPIRQQTLFCGLMLLLSPWAFLCFGMAANIRGWYSCAVLWLVNGAFGPRGNWCSTLGWSWRILCFEWSEKRVCKGKCSRNSLQSILLQINHYWLGQHSKPSIFMFSNSPQLTDVYLKLDSKSLRLIFFFFEVVEGFVLKMLRKVRIRQGFSNEP